MPKVLSFLLISSQEFDPWGKIRSGSLIQTKLNYTGQTLDGTGLLYYHSRYYDPSLARFKSADSIIPGGAAGTIVDYHETGGSGNFYGYGASNAQSLARYTYVLNNPVNGVDPTGHRGRQSGTTDPQGEVIALPPLICDQKCQITRAIIRTDANVPSIETTLIDGPPGQPIPQPVGGLCGVGPTSSGPKVETDATGRVFTFTFISHCSVRVAKMDILHVLEVDKKGPPWGEFEIVYAKYDLCVSFFRFGCADLSDIFSYKTSPGDYLRYAWIASATSFSGQFDSAQNVSMYYAP